MRTRQLIAVAMTGLFGQLASVTNANEPAALPAPAPVSVVPIDSPPQPKTVAPTPPNPDDAIRELIRSEMKTNGEIIIRSTEIERLKTLGSGVAAPAAPSSSAKPAAPSGAAASPAPAAAAATAPAKTAEEKPAPPKPAVPPAPTNWSFDGERGPAAWGKLHPSFASCERGRFQSPIDIRDGIGVDLPRLEFAYAASRFRVIDSGKTLVIEPAEPGSFSVQGAHHRLSRIEVRHPAEMQVNGKGADMSLNFHHVGTDKRVSIVSVPLSATGKENPAIQQILNNLPLLSNQAFESGELRVDFNQLVPADSGYFTFMGSLTAPPCTEGVVWYVMKTPVLISPEQLAIFARLYPKSARPVQPANNRLIKESRGR
jgi:carbonic anhydrase